MSNILLIANLNCDRVIELDNEIASGRRVNGTSTPRRLGGAAANCGVALVFAGHDVCVACSVGSDETGDWLIHEAKTRGLDTGYIQRYDGNTPEVLVMLSPSKERTIFFIDRRPPFRPPDTVLEHAPACLFVNSPCGQVAELMQASLPSRRVIAQMPGRHISYWPAHILIASEVDLDSDAREAPFHFGRAIAGETLEWMVVTRGASGADAYSATRRISVPASPANAVDTTGAGDVFAAGLIDALVARNSMQNALSAGAAWAAFAVESTSSAPPERLRTFLARQ